MDWNKYEQDTLVSGSVDRTIRCFDLRMPPTFNRHSAPRATPTPVYVLESHQLAVRAVACSPFNRFAIASGSYDMCAFLWNVQGLVQPLKGTATAARAEAAAVTTPAERSPSSLPPPPSAGRQADRAIPRRFVSPRPRLLGRHKEFVSHVDFNVFEHEVAHCSWDSTVCIHPIPAGPPAS